VAVLHDPTGGGNTHILASAVSTDYMAECFVYVMGGNPLSLANEGEAWAMGVGTTDSFGSPVDVPGTYWATVQCTGAGNRSPGATGIAWMAYVLTAQTSIYLVDMNDGGPGFTVLAGPIVATPGVNDGWQRLRIRASGTSLIANFGGNFGVDDGQRFTATITPRAIGHVYFQYRECVLANANLRPLILDRLEVYGTLASSFNCIGTPSATNFGTPNISATGLPSVGAGGFSIDASGLVPGGISLVALDAGPLLPGIPVPGAPPTLLVYASPTFLGTVFNSIAGTGSFAFGIPPVNSLLGAQLSTQYFDLDPTLPFALPFGSSRGCQLTVGNGP
jgi:hypothetical protein